MKTLILSLSTAFVFVCSVCAADAPAGSQAEATKLVAAIVTDDYKGFVANGNVAFQGLKKDQFEAVVSQLGPKLKAGYDLTYLGDRISGAIRSRSGASASNPGVMTCLPP